MPAPSAGRTPFVGRETQFGALRSAAEAAELGESVLVLVSGEPGIGKTRLVAEVAAHVAARVVWTTCWDGEGAPPYWPWRQLLRAISEDDEYAVPAVADALAGLEGDASTGSGPDLRFRMFDAVADGLATASRIRPLMLVLDDLHWADESTIRLLQFLVRDTRPRRLSIIGTYRDTDLDPSHPLATGLADVARSGLQVSLGGLGPRDVSALVTSVEPSASASPDAVTRLHRQSGGNPFFLSELLQLKSSGAASDAAPANVRAVVSRRLSRLPDAARDLLAAASVLGGDADLTIVSKVSDCDPSTTRSAVVSAQTAGLAVPTAKGIGFVHDLVREVLYAELDVDRRAALHARAATVLEEMHGADRSAEIAHHLFAAALGEPDEHCLDYAIRAAERSWQQHAYQEAGHWFQRALEVVSTSDAAETDLRLRLGEAMFAAGDWHAARGAYERAADLARRSDDPDRLAYAALGLGAGLGGFEVRLLDPLQIDLLEEALVALGQDPSAMRAWLLARLSVALSLIADQPRRQALSQEAVAVARSAAEPRAIGYALAAWCDAVAGPDGCDERARAAAEIVRIGDGTSDRQLELLGRRLQVVALLEVGDVGSADAAMEQFALLAERLRQPLYRWYVPLWRGMRALMRGESATATRYGLEAEEIGARADSANALALTFTQTWVRLRYEGDQHEAGTAMGDLLSQAAAAPRYTVGPRAVVAALLGDRSRARKLLVEWLNSASPERTRDSEWLPETAQLAQVAVATGSREVAERLYADLRPYAQLFCVEGIGAAFTGSVAWYLALLARFLGRTGEAEDYARRARDAHARVGLLVEPPPLGEAAEASAPAALLAQDAAALEWDGGTWAMSWAGKTARLRDSKGLRDLAILLARPEHEVHCLELVGGSDVGSSPGPALDAQARRAYEQRIRDLQSDIDEAHEMADAGRAERAEDELDALVHQLSEAFGLSGRSRATGSAAERARSAVSWRLRAAIRNIADLHPELARHLRNAIRTGTWCSYRPETAVTWVVRQERSA